MWNRFQIALVAFMLGVILGVMLYDGCNKPRIEQRITRDTLRERMVDTVVKVEYRERLVIREAPATITPLARARSGDSLIATEPFVARLDTIAQGDTLALAFTLARARVGWFDVDWRRRPDSVRTIIDVRTERVTEVQQTIERLRPHIAIGIGAFGGVNIDPQFVYGAGLTLSYIIESW